MEGKKGGIPPQLLQELVELRRLETDKEALLSTNKFYMNQIGEFEIKVSELVVHHKLKSKELDKLRQTSFSTEPTQKENPESKLHTLELENEGLKHLASVKVCLYQLKLELSHVNHTRSTYEAKYKELLGNTVTTDEEAEVAKLEDIYRQQIDLTNDLITERDYIRSEVIPFLETSMNNYEQEKRQIEAEISEAKGETERLSKCKSATTEDPPENTAEKPVESSNSSVNSTQKKPKQRIGFTPRAKDFCPTFSRNKTRPFPRKSNK